MRWKIRQFEFCEEHRWLRDGEEEVYLEPLLVEVLAYLCRHPGEVIDRERLVAEVWDAKAISDNAVSRVIARLRKALGDNPKAPEFIVTYPKKGYKLIAPTERLEPENEVTSLPAEPIAVPDEPVIQQTFLRWPLLAGLVVLLVIVGLLLRPMEKVPLQTELHGVAALTRGGGREFLPALSPDGRYLTYSAYSGDRMCLYLQDTEQFDRVEIGDPKGFSGPAYWSPDGTSIVYLVTTEEGAFYYRALVEGLTVGERSLVHQGPRGSYGKMAFDQRGERLIFTEAAAAGQPYELFEIELVTGIRRRLPQPELVLGGNSQFDVHPTRNALLISSPNANQWLDIYALDLETDQIRHLFELREYTCCAVWSHDGEHVVLMGDYPARELVRFDLQGHGRQVILQVPQRVSWPSRHPNGVDYIYEGGSLNRDIGYLAWEDGAKPELVVDSSVDDRLGVVSPDGQWLAFVSERSGKDEVWLLQLTDGTLRKLTSFGDNRFYYDLQWSPDGAYLAGMTINQLDLIDVADGQARRLDVPREEMRGLSWRDPRTLSFSMQGNGSWRIVTYDRETNTIQPYAGEDALVHHGLVAEDSLWFDGEGQVFYGPERIPLNNTFEETLYRRRFNLIKRGDAVYHVKRSAGMLQLLRYNLKGDAEVVIASKDLEWRFSLSDQGVYFSKATSFDADIYRTTSR